MSLADNLLIVRKKISASLKASGREENSVEILAVSKRQSLEKIESAKKAGLHLFGENYVQEFLNKYVELKDKNLRWHFIGYLQTNKIKQIIGKVELIHGVDRISLAQEISKQACKINTVQDVLIQINIAEEATKSGVSPKGFLELIHQVLPLKNIRLRGVMTMPPIDVSADESKLNFRKANGLFQEARKKFQELEKFDVLSMGTSHDYQWAVEEGATIIRLGTSLLGSRGT